MKIKIVKAAALILAMLCILCFPIPASAVSQGTDGTELQVMKPQNLQIHLGEEWAGIGFELTTDAGKYPGVIPVGEDGVLRLEIGGSENYILSCMNSIDDLPEPGESQPSPNEADATVEPSEDISVTESAGNTESGNNESLSEETEQGSVAGMPMAHIVMFGGGLIVAICTLVGIQFHQKRNGRIADDDDI